MVKRLILVVVSVLAVVLALLLYRQFAGESAAPLGPLDEYAHEDAEIPADVPMVSVRDEVAVGHIAGPRFQREDREFGFDRRVPGEAGFFEITGPWVKFYGGDGQVISLTAERGRIPVDSDAPQARLPESGTLQGEVRLEILRDLSDEAGGDAELVSELLIELERVDFELEFSELRSAGGVAIHSNQFELRGRDLTFQYDQVQQRLRSLELQVVEQMRLDAASVSSRRGADDTAPGADKADATDEADTATDEDELVTYRMRLEDEIVLRQGDDEMRADVVEVLVSLDAGDLASDAQDDATPDPCAATKEADAPAAAPDDADELEWITITCGGPLRIAAVAPEDIPAPQAVLTARGRPVVVQRGGQPLISADTIVYDLAAERMSLNAGPGRPVWLMQEEQGGWLTAGGGVQFEYPRQVAQLRGPGRIVYPDPCDPCDSVQVDYADTMAIRFAAADDATQGALDYNLGPVEQLDFRGAIDVVSGGEHVRAGGGALRFDPCAEPGEDGTRQRPRIREITLWDDVRAIDDEGGGFQCRRVRAEFTEHGGETQLVSLRAAGDVKAAREDFSIAASDYLLLEFDPKALATAPQADRPAEESAGSTAWQQLSEGFADAPLKLVEAAGAGGGVRLIDPNQGYEVIGDRLEGGGFNPPQLNADANDASSADATDRLSKLGGFWRVWGEPAVVRGLSSEERLTAPIITLDLNEGLCSAPGAGSMTFASTMSLTGHDLAESAAVTVNWQEGALYSMGGREIVLSGVNLTIDELSLTTRQRHEMMCRQMTVTLAAEDDPCAQDDSQPQLRELERLKARGPDIQVISETFSVDGATPLDRMELTAPALAFDNRTERLDVTGPGWIELVEHARAEKQDDAGTPSSLDTALGGLGGGSGPHYTLVRFRDSLSYHASESSSTLLGDVSVYRTPVVKRLPRSVLDALREDGAMRLHCDHLTAAIDDEQAEANDVAPGRLSLAPLRAFHAEGDVFCELVVKGRGHVFEGRSAAFDDQSGELRFQGDEMLPVRFDGAQLLWLNYHVVTGQYAGEWVGASEFFLAEAP